MHYLRAMRRYATFRGRSPRIEFIEFIGAVFLLSFVAVGLDRQVIGEIDGERSELLFGLVAIVHFLPLLAVTARRLHDLDHSGWFALVALVPFLGFAVLLLALPPGTSGPNRFGPDPLAAGHDATGPLPAGAFGASPVAPATQRPSTTEPRDVVAELERLAALRASGSLSEDEFRTMKTRLLQPGRSGLRG